MLSFLSDAEPLRPWTAPSHVREDGIVEWALEYTSRGDRVPARILVPAEGGGPFPVVVAQHGLGGHKTVPYMDAAVVPWVRGGLAVASIDFPLHGERANPKLSERITDLGSTDPGLWRDLVEQAVIDLRRLVLALDADTRIDGGRIAYAGFSLGTILGTLFCAEEPRIRAAALAIGGAGIGPDEADPAHWVGRIAPRPILFVQAERDERIPRESALALHAAAGDPHTVEWYDAGHQQLPGAALKSMRRFLDNALRK